MGFNVKSLYKENSESGTTQKSSGFNVQSLRDRKFELKTDNDTLIGSISYGAKRAIEGNTLDSYTPANDEERKVLDKYVKYQGLSSSFEQLKKDIEENTPRNASFWDNTVNSFKKGWIQSLYGQEAYKAMTGQKNNKDYYKQMLDSEDYSFVPDNWFEKAISGASELLGQQVKQWTDPRSIAAGTAAAGTVAIAGQAGPQIAAPEEIITVPGAFLTGMAAGSATANFEIEAGNAYEEMIENGISPSLASKIALGVGGANAALEMVQADDLIKSFKILNKSNATKPVAKKILSYMKDRGINIATETAQEVGQEASTIIGVQTANKIEKGEFAYDASEVARRLGETAASSALSFGLLGTGGDVVKTGVNRMLDTAVETAAKRKGKIVAESSTQENAAKTGQTTQGKPQETQPLTTNSLDEVVETAKESKSPDVVKAAERVETALENNETPSTTDVAKVVDEVAQQVENEAPAPIETPTNTETVATNDVPASEVVVGDKFKAKSNGNVLTILSRDENNTVVQIDTGKKQEQRTYTNAQADTLLTNAQFEQIEKAPVSSSNTVEDNTPDTVAVGDAYIDPITKTIYNVIEKNGSDYEVEMTFTNGEKTIVNPDAAFFKRMLTDDKMEKLSADGEVLASKDIATSQIDADKVLNDTNGTLRVDENGAIRFNQKEIDYTNNNLRNGSYKVIIGTKFDKTETKTGRVVGKYGVSKNNNGKYSVVLLSSGITTFSFDDKQEAEQFAVYVNENIPFNDVKYKTVNGSYYMNTTDEFKAYADDLKRIHSSKEYVKEIAPTEITDGKVPFTNKADCVDYLKSHIGKTVKVTFSNGMSEERTVESVSTKNLKTKKPDGSISTLELKGLSFKDTGFFADFGNGNTVDYDFVNVTETAESVTKMPESVTETPENEKNTPDSVSEETSKSKKNDLFKKLTDSIPLLENDAVVYEATGNEFEVGEKKLSQQVYEYFESLGGVVHRDNFGDVAINDKGVDSSIAHGMGRAKAIAFASVPAVIEKGRQIDFVENWKGRNYDSYVFAAPIRIGTQKAFVGVVVTKSDTDNRYYLHEVSDNEGNIIIIKKDDVSFKSKSEADNDNSSLGETSPTDIIPQEKEIVNTSQAENVEQPVTSINEQNMPISTENTPVNEDVTNIDVYLPEAFKRDENGKIRFNQVDIDYTNNQYREETFKTLKQGGTDTETQKVGIIGKYGIHKKSNGYFGVNLLSSGMDIAAFESFDDALKFATYTNENVSFNDVSYTRNAEGRLTIEATPEFMQYGEQIRTIKNEKAYLQTETAADDVDASFPLEDVKFSKETEKGVLGSEKRNNVTARSVGRSVSESTDKSGRSLYETTGRTEEKGGQRTDTEGSRRIYAENVRNVQGTEIRQQGAFRCEFIKPDYYTDDMRAIEENNKKQGIKHTYFFFDSGEVAFKSSVKFKGAVTKNGDVYIQCNHAKYSPEQINKHELVHRNYNTEDVKKVREYINDNLTEEEKRHIIDVMYSRYAEHCKGGVNKIFEEFVCDVLSGINSYGGKFADISQEYWSEHTDLIDSYSAADYSDSIDAGGVSLSSQEFVLYDGQPMYSIEKVNGTDKLYVKADRQVVEGATPKEWGASVEKYINDSIRQGKDVQLVAADGDVLTITSDTAGKAKFRNYVTRPDGTSTIMEDAEYRTKLNAESHIDELSLTSRRGKKDVPDYKNHAFAKDGFNYRTAYFEDFDGQYYKVTLSVGKNGEINTVYNVGKIKEAPFPLVAQRPGTESTGGHKASTDSITDKSQNVNTEDINFSLEDDGEFDLFDLWEQKNKEFGTIKKGENPTRDIDVPKKITKEKLVSQFARTMLEAGVTPDTAVSEFEKRVLDGTMTHEVVTDDSAREWAINQIRYHGFEEALNTWGVYTRDGNVGKKELALGMKLYNQCITSGDVTNAMKIAAELVAEATHAGQTLQATRMLKLMTPDGQLYYLEKSIQKMNDEFKKKIGDKYENIKLNEELMEKFLTEKEADKRDEIYDNICQDIADQIPPTLLDKWKSWRYLAMLGNPRTHIRNIAGNAVFAPAIKLKNYIGAVIEKVAKVDTSKRTKSLHRNKKAVEFAKNDFAKMLKVLQGENAKYAVTSDIEGKRTIFKTKWLESLRTKNFEWLEKEDMWFLEMHYVDALAQIITARKLDVDNIDEKTLDVARAYAVREAQRATYRDANSIAEALNKLQKKASHSDKKAVRAANILIEGVMPFKKTPLNIAKQGVQYSPVGILSGVYKTVSKIKDGDAFSTTDVIDDFAKGLTGTALMLLGTLLASLGIISGGDDENKKKKEFDKMVGEQSFSLNIGDKSYTIDWAAPTCLPLFTGVELYDLTKDNFKFADIANALSSLTDPLLELSVFSGISGTIESARYNNTNTLFAIGTDMVTSYLTQALPTIGGQISRIIDKNKREYYYTDKNSSLPIGIQSFIGQVSSKIPFASYLFEPSIDEWGREETYGGIVERTLENVVSPGYYSEKNYTAVDEEIKRLYEITGDADVLPVIQQKKYTESKIDYPMTATQYTEAKKLRGQKSFELIEQLLSNRMSVKLQNKQTGKYQTKLYSQMSDEEKIRAIKRCYENAGDYTKETMLEEVKVSH